MVRSSKRWFAWMVAAFCAAVPAVAQAASEEVDEETEDVAEAESAFVEAGGFSASQFPFATIVQDDGTDIGGGWQAASTVLHFFDGRKLWAPNVWSCQVVVELPIRHSIHGGISPQKAAQVSAAAATVASTVVMRSRPTWIRATYCPAFAVEMTAQLNMLMARLGARVRAQ